MKFWNKDNLQKALGEECKLYNMPDDWEASGFRIWHTPLNEGDAVYMRSEGETRGATRKFITPIISKISALLCLNYDEFKDYNVPIIEIKDLTKAFFALARFIRKSYKGKVVAITGSAGKSTTTKMIYEALKDEGAEANLNLANTLIAICWNMTTFDINKKYWVIESSIGNGYAAFADVAVVTNLAAVHLKSGQTIEGMARGKSKIFSTMRPNSTAILNREMECYEIFEEEALQRQLKITTVGEREGVDIRIFAEENSIEIDGKKYYVNQDYVPKYLLYNMASVVGVAKVFGLDIEKTLQKLENFQCIAGRGETSNLKFQDKNITLVDEAFNANPLSMTCTIEAFGRKFKENKVLILGDMAECGDKSQEYHLALADVIKNANPSKIILCGNEMQSLYEVLKSDYVVHHFEDIDKLLEGVSGLINEGDNIFVKSSHSTGLYKLVSFFKK